MYSFFLLIFLSLSAAQIPGGTQPIDVTNPAFMNKIWAGFAQINAASNAPNYIVPVQIVSGTSQIVSGTKYTFTVQMAETSCSKANTSFDRNTCVPSANAPTSLYKVTLWEQPWLNFAEYTVEKI